MPEKIIVAVHGIGEQIRSETIQAVANQLCLYCDLPPTMPLGRFTAKLLVAPGVPPTEFTLKMQKGAGGPPDSYSGELKQVLVPPAVPGAFLIQTPPDPEFARRIGDPIGFGEVYWADI